MERFIESNGPVKTISHSTLCDAVRRLESPQSLRQVLGGTEIHLSSKDAVQANAPTARNPEVEARVDRLRAQLHDEQYAHMVRDVSRATGTNAEVDALRMAKFAPQLSLGANVIVTMATCFVAGYFVMKNTSGSETMGLVGGVAGMIVAMGVEAILLVTKMYTIDNAVSAQVRLRERAAARGVRRD